MAREPIVLPERRTWTREYFSWYKRVAWQYQVGLEPAESPYRVWLRQWCWNWKTKQFDEQETLLFSSWHECKGCIRKPYQPRFIEPANVYQGEYVAKDIPPCIRLARDGFVSFPDGTMIVKVNHG